MDGVSTDDTVKVAQSYNDSRIRIYSEPDRGVYDAMNKGIKKSKGEWLYFLGSDDWLLTSDVLQKVFSAGIDKYDVVYGDVEAPQLDVMHKGEWSMSTINYNRCHQAIFYRRMVFERLGRYNLDYPIWADYALNLKWYFSSNISHKYLPVAIAHYSEGGLSNAGADTALVADYPYVLLMCARKRLCRNQKINLISESLKSANLSVAQRVCLTVWGFCLRQVAGIKRLRLNAILRPWKAIKKAFYRNNT